MLGVVVRDLLNGGSWGGACILAIVCSTYSLNVVRPSLDCMDTRSAGVTIGRLCGTEEDGGITDVVVGGQTDGCVSALHEERGVVAISVAPLFIDSLDS